ncbi:hypothetical protein D3C81_1753780 [compost metagenome]
MIDPASSRENSVGALAAMNSPRKISSKYSTSSAALPIRPNSSEKTAKMKSVCFSGMNSRWVCVPLRKPLPSTPPEPIAMIDWMVWKPLPSGSLVGSSSVHTRCCW